MLLSASNSELFVENASCSHGSLVSGSFDALFLTNFLCNIVAMVVDASTEGRCAEQMKGIRTMKDEIVIEK